MALSVREALDNTALKYGKLLAGKEGLDKRIKWVTIVEVLEDISRLAEGELLITTAYGIEWETGKKSEFIKRLADKKLSGVAIMTGFYLPEISNEFIEQADQFNLPLIELPSFLNFSDITRSILQKIVQSQYDLLDFSETIHQELLQLMLLNKSFPAIAELLSKYCGGNAAVYDVNWEATAFENPLKYNSHYQSELINSLTVKEFKDVLDQREILCYESLRKNMPMMNMVAPIAADEKTYGYIVISKPLKLTTEVDRISIRHAAMVCAIEFLKINAVKETEWRMQGDFLEEILARKWINTSMIMERGKIMGFDFSVPHNVLIIKLCNIIAGQGDTGVDQNLIILCEMAEQVFKASNIKIFVKFRHNSLVLLLEGQTLFREEISAAAEAIQERWSAVSPNIKIVIGIGSNRRLIEHLARCAEEAELSLRFGHFLKSRNQICFYADLGIFHWLIELYEQKVDLRAMRDNILGVLVEYDRKHGNQLMETLETYLAMNQNIQQTASALYIHRHTLKYRLSRIEYKTGMNLKNHHHRIQLQMAIYIHKFLQALE
ncbi:purine catabolism regulatory protein [Desulfotomaculum arcticum]|uniref:Purine catabolism regulatory protein n=1 Tax=Desulfotruncus arcticus DSM 17038 TaxID=1121424 RepID=A0A1I2TMF7_9FIRM|nr:PucR family transcriptional regulator [Desulfotruncus arcticus]SFG64547.1 purine catabolism regulatory protein [Desulfotomaculum arcticum] [Desulfotruncus arcticus DSM 17038]